MDARISEAASEKARRGRPPLVSPTFFEKYAAYQGLRCKTTRQAQEHWYAMKAVNALLVVRGGKRSIPAKYAWLVRDDPPHMRISILAQLGRIGDHRAIRDLATHLCSDRPRTKKALKILRILRE